jgi:PAS domain S-box-containing protein
LTVEAQAVAWAPKRSFLAGGGQVGAMMRAHDWSRSALGPPETWPQSLRSVVGLLLNSKFPMFVAWGRELGFLYNDAYAEILGAKHPAALGARFHDIWAEIWPDISPLVDAAMAGEATYREDLPLVMNRRGYDEPTWFTFSYSPVCDESGDVAGLFCAVAETTGRVLGERALAEHEEQLRLATEAAEVGFWDLDVVTDTLFWPPRVKRMFGISPEIPISMDDFYAGLHPEDRERVSEAFAAAIDPDRRALYDQEYRTVGREDGLERWVAAKGRAIFDEGGRCVRVIGTAIDITVRKTAEAHLRLMVNELNHRVKNSLATVQGIAAQTLRRGDIPGDVRDALTARLVALARAHDVLTTERWTGAELREIAENAAAPYAGSGGVQAFVIDGPPVSLPPKTAIALALVFHELATNAVKYGALKAPGGRVRIDWTVTPGATGPRLGIVWREEGGPPVTPPKAAGFGTQLIQRGLSAELHGAVTLSYPPDGVVCRLETVILEREAAWDVGLQLV